MTMQNEVTPDHTSLASRIGDAEGQLALRRLDASRHAALLKRRAREKLGSPLALVAVAGLGFAAGRVTRGRSTPRPAARGPRRVSLIAWIFDAVALAGSLMALWRSARGTHAPHRP